MEADHRHQQAHGGESGRTVATPLLAGGPARGAGGPARGCVVNVVQIVLGTVRGQYASYSWYSPRVTYLLMFKHPNTIPLELVEGTLVWFLLVFEHS